jgi:hypothetical protein
VDCPYITETPETADGAAAWLAGSRCLTVSLGYGAADMRMDWGAALTVAVAEGCDPRAAPELLRAIADGLAKARADQRKDGT